MNTEQTTPERRVRRRYSAADRERLIEEQRASAQTKKAFCQARGISLGTFHSWIKKRTKRPPRFAQVTLPGGASPAPIEVSYPNGVRVSLRLSPTADEALGVIRQLAGVEPGRRAGQGGGA